MIRAPPSLPGGEEVVKLSIHSVLMIRAPPSLPGGEEVVKLSIHSVLMIRDKQGK